jgi:entericidin B
MIYSNLKLAVLLALAVGSMAMTACNTIDGAGQDIEGAGEAVQDAAD